MCWTLFYGSSDFQEMQYTQRPVPEITSPFAMYCLDFYSFLSMNNRILNEDHVCLLLEWKFLFGKTSWCLRIAYSWWFGIRSYSTFKITSKINEAETHQLHVSTFSSVTAFSHFAPIAIYTALSIFFFLHLHKSNT